MRRAIAGTALALLVAGAAFGQAAEPMEFEVASVKPAPPRAPGTGVGTRGCFGGPGSQTPVRYSCTNVTVSMMVVYAYGVKGTRFGLRLQRTTTHSMSRQRWRRGRPRSR